MSSFAKTAASLACLAAVTMATPLMKRGEWDCPTGNVFYSCSNGYRGCFEKDPCALPPAATTSLASPSTTTTSIASSSTSFVAAACPNGTKGSVWQPSMYNLFPEDPDHSEPSVSFINVSTRENKPPVEQAIVFRGIPSEAKTCNINWDQAAESERNFTVEDSGYVSLLQLNGFPYGEPVSSSSVAAFEPAGAKPVHGDFTFWDKQSKTAWPHFIGPVNCSSEIYFRLALDTLSGFGHVFMDQDKKNGFHIDYTC
ncbi:hypothetical protein F4815DRAFT_442219 [Daldinia loculata]|uniref:uncharacterized protein n=1 Tax=Daldinia loculata TaxID=103429 RepID=UPI0020C5089B|nr:uncharacterized protein F4817DRAFT_327752 [Daldinia loculata]KAI1650442.1 hypothetical protein F4817DRAFT_327752 [Daldinia loculata]KAI2783347.1 hypothetical protein F4815DRAFT_442219 [Daldinia loculata]